MTKLVAAIGAAFALVTIGAPAYGANGQASCTGIAVSSVAGIPGLTAELTRQFHQELKDQGMPPGLFDSTFSKLHEGSLEGCLAAAGG